MHPVDKQSRDAEVTRITTRIAALIEEHFRSGAESLFLSRLGVLLGDDRIRLERLTGEKLSQFIRNNFSYEIGAGGQKSNVLFLVKPGMSAETPPSSKQIPRYSPRFWAAFAVPLAENEQRYVNLESLVFGPDAATLGAPDYVFPIPTEYIAPRNASGSAADTAARIERWLETHRLEAERFLAKRKHPQEYRSLLDALLHALDGDELKRVSLPLDIVKTLSERKN